MELKNRKGLLIQGIILLEVIILVFCGVWFGLCRHGDQLCFPILSKFSSSHDNILKNSPPLSLSKPRTVKKIRRFRVKLTLQLEDESAWEIWTNALNNWLDSTDFFQWPSWQNSNDLGSEIKLGGMLTSKSYKHGDTNVVKKKLLLKYLDWEDNNRSLQKKNILSINLYIPKVSSLLVLDDEKKNDMTSASLTVNDNSLLILVQKLDVLPDEAINDAMLYLIPFLVNHHGIPTSENGIYHTQSDMNSWLEAVFLSYHEESQSKLWEIHNEVLSKAKQMLIPAEINNNWSKAKSLIEEGQRFQKDGKIRKSIKTLEIAFEQLESLRTSDLLITPLHFPIEHQFAIFAPLLFPLLLPFVIGAVREYKKIKSTGKEK